MASAWIVDEENATISRISQRCMAMTNLTLWSVEPLQVEIPLRTCFSTPISSKYMYSLFRAKPSHYLLKTVPSGRVDYKQYLS